VATPTIHPQWLGLDLHALGLLLSEHLSSGPLSLIHAHSNLIWKDNGDLVYKLTPHRARRRCEANLRVVTEIFLQEPSFPTIHPASMEVFYLDFGEHDRWALTIWDYIPLTPLIPDRNETAIYRTVGKILSDFHYMGIEVSNRHDALQWAESRAHSIQDNASLFDEIAELRHRYEEVFSGEPDATLHGDFHWHQTALDTSGRLLLLDFENAAQGPAVHDLFPSAGWVKRTGVPTHKQILALREGYGDRWPESSEFQKRLLRDIRNFSRKTWDLAYGERLAATNKQSGLSRYSGNGINN